MATPAIETPKSFPVGSRVILKELTKGTEFNGKVGVIKSKLQSTEQDDSSSIGRQQVLLIQSGKMLRIKPTNLKYEPRSVKSLSVSELKAVLVAKKVSPTQMTGYDKAQLREMVKIKTDDSGEELARTVYEIQERETQLNAASAGGAGGDLRQQMESQAAAMGNMSPEQLRQQAQMMRSMPPSQIRRMNPAMANFSDSQIQAAANQMEMMANNPQMMKGMMEQMKKMSPAELEQMKKMQQGGGAPGAAPPGAAGAPGSAPQNNQRQSLANMSPEQLRQQATMMKSMTPDTLRSMNPAMANWSDSQIQMSIEQMETMANNPDMLKRMSAQMKNMKPEDVEKMRKMAESGNMGGMGGVPPGADAGAGGASGMPAPGQDPMDMLKSTDPSQIKQMLQMAKENPQLMKDLLSSGNPAMAGGLGQMSDEQLQKTINAFASMDESKIGLLLKVFGWVQQFRNSKKMKIGLFVLLSMFVFVVGMLIYLVKNSKNAVGSGSGEEGVASFLEEESVPIITEEQEF